MLIEALESRQLLSSVTVMTQNVYYGGGGLGGIASGFTDLWDRVEESKIPERAAAIARQIKRQKPDLVALQEAVIWRTGTPFLSSSARSVEFDFTAEIARRLRKGKARYKVVSRAINADWEVPGQVGSSIRDIRMTDQDVILARVGAGSRVKVLRARHGTYRQQAPDINLLGQEIDFTRGWASVDARVGKSGPKFRFINTHLEVFSSQVQERQARELLAGPAGTRLPVILAGDFNSNANSGGSTVGMITDAGFEDSWARVHPGDSGPTCCQDDDLRNGESELSTRIDLIFYGDDDFDAVSATRVGEEAADKTPSGLWPSDHAGVVARIEFQ
jgi:endonuclease/exonuclease/phosphatase family metal-dependent hydrolase